MSVSISAFSVHRDRGTPLVSSPAMVDSMGDIVRSWGYPYRPVAGEVVTVTLSDLGAPVVRDITSTENVRAFLLATLTPDWHGDAQPAVELLDQVGHPDLARVSCWSLTEHGLLAALLAIRLAQLSISRVGGDALVVTADRRELPYTTAELTVHQQVAANQAVGLRLSATEGPGLAYAETSTRDQLRDTVVNWAADDRAVDRIVLGGDCEGLLKQQDSMPPVIIVEPGQPLSGLVAQILSPGERVICAVWDPQLHRGAGLVISVDNGPGVD